MDDVKASLAAINAANKETSVIYSTERDLARELADQKKQAESIERRATWRKTYDASRGRTERASA